MKTPLFVITLTITFLAAPALAQLGPAGVPGAPGLAPEPVSSPAPAMPAPPPPPAKAPEAAPKIHAACVKAKNTEQCMKRQEAQRKAKAACKGKTGDNYKQCVKNHPKRKKSPAQKPL